MLLDACDDDNYVRWEVVIYWWQRPSFKLHHHSIVTAHLSFIPAKGLPWALTASLLRVFRSIPMLVALAMTSLNIFKILMRVMFGMLEFPYTASSASVMSWGTNFWNFGKSSQIAAMMVRGHPL